MRSRELLFQVAAFVIVVAGLRAAGTIAVLLLVSAFFATLTVPPVLWLKRKRVPSAVAVVIVVVAIMGIFAVMGLAIRASIDDFVRAVPDYGQRLNAEMGQFVEWARSAGLSELALRQLRSIEPGTVMNLLGNAVGALGGLLEDSLLVLLVVLFTLFEVSSFPAKLRVAFGGTEGPVERYREVTGKVLRYLLLKGVTSLCMGLLIGIWVAVVGLDFPVIWGLLAFVLNFIPYFGPLIAATPAVLLALVQLGLSEAVTLSIGYLAVHFVIGNFVEPRVVGAGLGLSSLVVVLSLLTWNWVFGTIGLFLAAPLTVALRIVLDAHPNTHWIAVLMGPAREVAKPAA